ncbi:hypothetical protein JCM19241_5212 [Vibrio ishigakensis]|uniref:Uncharacterized protein n=1 Tax=Vibrio ishigakensis TaxID=1481914 RepID=A0A0B8Q643_9VIBR|nr:hypothetical protein JCM19241_5212 [Vibrio ishigakensis]
MIFYEPRRIQQKAVRSFNTDLKPKLELADKITIAFIISAGISGLVYALG